MTNKVQNRLVDKFLAEIEEFLQDLGPELRDDILREVRENLEARAEDDPDNFTLPNSLVYANDLRQAAGLEPVTHPKKVLMELLVGMRAKISKNPLAKAARTFLKPFKPLFWIAIGVSAFGYVQLYILGNGPYPGVPSDLEQWLLWLAMVLGAVWIGSSNLTLRLRQARSLIIAVLAIPLALMFVDITAGIVKTVDDRVNGNPAMFTSGLIYNGLPVTNIFPYDADGNLLHDVRLVDDQGRPLNSSANQLVTPLMQQSANGEVEVIGYLRPSEGVDGAEVWNVYPLKSGSSPVGFGTYLVSPAD